MLVVRISIVFVVLFSIGCSSVQPEHTQEKLSCEEKAKPKSLQYIEQQYRCTAKKGE